MEISIDIYSTPDALVIVPELGLQEFGSEISSTLHAVVIKPKPDFLELTNTIPSVI
jgi:hypothetical protein